MNCDYLFITNIRHKAKESGFIILTAIYWQVAIVLTPTSTRACIKKGVEKLGQAPPSAPI